MNWLTDLFKKPPPPPKPVGYWRIYGIKMAQFRKPLPEHIKNHEKLLGWVWEDR